MCFTPPLIAKRGRGAAAALSAAPHGGAAERIFAKMKTLRRIICVDVAVFPARLRPQVAAIFGTVKGEVGVDARGVEE